MNDGFGGDRERSDMSCPACGQANSRVTDTRGRKDRSTIRRRRKCLTCDNAFTTYETSITVPLGGPVRIEDLIEQLQATVKLASNYIAGLKLITEGENHADKINL